MAYKFVVLIGEKTSATSISSFLKRKGHQVLFASSGSDAVDLVEDESPHAILVDFKTSCGTSFDAVQTIKKSYFKTEIVVLSENKAAPPKIDILGKKYSSLLPPSFNSVLTELSDNLSKNKAKKRRSKLSSKSRKKLSPKAKSKKHSRFSRSIFKDALNFFVKQQLAHKAPFEILAFLRFPKDTEEAKLSIFSQTPVSKTIADSIKTKVTKAAKNTAFDTFGSKIKIIEYALENKTNKTKTKKLDSTICQELIFDNKCVGIFLLATSGEPGFTKEQEKGIKQLITDFSVNLEHIHNQVLTERVRLQTVSEGIGESIFLIGPSGELSTMNPPAKKLMGNKLDSGISVYEMCDFVTAAFDIDPSGSVIKSWVKEILAGDKMFFIEEFSVSHQNERIIRATLQAIKDPTDNTNVVGAILMLKDITSERLADRMQTDFISIVSHELQTPITIVKESLSIIGDGIYGDLNSNQARFVDIALRNLDRLSLLIADLIQISLLQSNTVKLDLEALNIYEAIGSIITHFKEDADKRKIKLKTNFKKSKSTKTVLADALKLNKILGNILKNCFKFMDDQGTISIEVKSISNYIQVKISDTGIGIAKEDIPKLFSKFKQISRMPKSGAQGTGLGLAICKEMIRLHRGKIWIESELNKGTNVIFTLPKPERKS